LDRKEERTIQQEIIVVLMMVFLQKYEIPKVGMEMKKKENPRLITLLSGKKHIRC
jgi:hypothetical protein